MTTLDLVPPPSFESDRVLERLTKLHPKLIDLSLERTYRLLEKLGNPHLRLPPVFHVAGTNGKGSVCAYVRAILEAQGACVHAYTSPHLVRFHERIRLGANPHGRLIDEDALLTLLETCESANAGEPITFFEITTCAAMLAFADNPADALVLEVGLGGRYDTTNVVETPAVTAITPVDLDHQDFLGSDLAEIASAKAGIIKPGVPVVVGPQHEAALDVIQAEAEAIGAPAFIEGQDWQVWGENGRLIYQDTDGLLDLPLPRLPGRHQIANAGTAIAMLRRSRFAVEEVAFVRGLREVVWPGRLQRIDKGPLVEVLAPGSELWLDGGHNPSAGAVVADLFADLNGRAPLPLVMIVGMLTTKDVAGFLSAFAPLAPRVMAVPIEGEPAARSADDLAAAAQRTGIQAEVHPSFRAALAACARAEPARVLICGSLYLAGQVLRYDPPA